MVKIGWCLIFVGEKILFCGERVFRKIMNLVGKEKFRRYRIKILVLRILEILVVMLVIKMILFCSYGLFYYGVILLGGFCVGYFVGYG